MLFWYHNDKCCVWEFRNEDRSRLVAAVCDEVVWGAREEPARSGLQTFLASRGLDTLPDRAFE